MAAIDTGSTAFMLVATALVMVMTPGLALFYAGMVRSKNVLSTTMHSLVALGVVGALWALVGFTLAFGPDLGGLVGGFDFALLRGVNSATWGPAGHRIPLAVFAMYQGMFAIITPALISGAIAERMRFRAYVLFIALWSVLVYAPLAHWFWGGGWLAKMGALDFAGGAVVHISSGVASLVAAVVVGKRRGWPSEQFTPHSLPLTVLGAGILWFGWFGFNAGSALEANGLAASTFLATNVAAAFGMLGWLGMEWWLRGKPTTLGAASGVVAGLGTITAASGYIDAGPAMLIGLVAGCLCYFGVQAKNRLGFDDALDVVGVHGVGGTTGMLLTGVFATTAINAGARDGLLYGNPAQLGIQAVAVLATLAFSGLMTFAILKVVGAVAGLRVDAEIEDAGLDLAEHAETAYEF